MRDNVEINRLAVTEPSAGAYDPGTCQWKWHSDLASIGPCDFSVSGDPAGPEVRRMQALARLVQAIIVVRKRAMDLLKGLVIPTGDLNLDEVELGQRADRMECDFVIRFIDCPADRSRPVDTYFDVCFRDDPDHPSEFYRFHPFKIVIGFF